MAQHNDTGKAGEERAVEFLAGSGYNILERNYHFKHKEVDIIAEIDNLIVFFEVKTRSEGFMESPAEAVTPKKQRFIIEAANYYIDQHNIQKEVRLDVISITFAGGKATLEHIPEAFHPEVKRTR